MDAAKNPDEHFNRHERKLLKRQQKLEERKMQAESSKSSIRKKKLFNYALVLIVLALIAALGFRFVSNFMPEESFTRGTVHWHADIDIEICGKHIDLPRSPVSTRVHGQPFLGTGELHTHDDNRVHMEGLFRNPEDISLGRFFDVIGVKFNEKEIFDYKNGRMCNDSKENKVSMLINGAENIKFRDYVMKDGDNIQIKYE